jgi:YidC/Oxa1 family membrane protein insertase
MDRRFILAVILMMLIAVVPSFLVKARRGTTPSRPAAGPPVAVEPSGRPTIDSMAAARPTVSPGVPAETVSVSSTLYTYQISTRGAAIVQGVVHGYRSLFGPEKGQPVRLLPDGHPVHQVGVATGNDTLWFSDWDFTPSASRLSVTGVTPLTLRASRGQVTAELTYTFEPDDYQVRVGGRIGGLGPEGGQLVLRMGDGLRQTETDTNANYYDFALVTKAGNSQLHRFSSLSRDVTTTFDGPFDWAAVKSKYFAIALVAVDDSVRLSGATARPLTSDKRRTRAEVRLVLPITASGVFGYRLYLGPMEQARLVRIGHDFDDINPYGWAIFRPIIRPAAIAGRWFLVWMHQNLHLAYGLCLVAFGILIRILLWPLNQKGMRASLRMQALQPELQAMQERYKDDPQQMQRQLMELYRKHGVNPFSGCWPMLLPWPILIALYVVFQYSIELRGQAFLWLPDLSQKDPYFILPIVMGLSMFGVSWVGMRGVPPNPQSKVMLYMMPVMMTVLFVTFASGLNLYYTVQNLVSIPQQWYLAKERLKRQPPPPPVPKRR